MSEDKGRPLPKFGEWDVNDPASAEGFTVIFNKARAEKNSGGKPESPSKENAASKRSVDPLKSESGSFTGTTVNVLCHYTKKSTEIRLKNGFAAFKVHAQKLDKV